MTRDRIPLGFPRFGGLHGNRCWTRAGPCKPAARMRGKNEKGFKFKDCTSLNEEKQDVERSLSTASRMPLLPITSPQTVEACRTLSVTNEDIFICSYPKSGTTWTQNLVCRLLSSHVGMTFDDDWHLSHTAPFYEVDKYWNSEGRLPPKTPICGNVRGTERSYRVFNTHLRPHQLPPSAKCVYVVRDPLDVLASFYHHLANMSEEDGGYVGTPGKFCSAFVDGSILYGKWQDHLEAWLGKANSNRSSLLILNYEDMKGDLAKQTTRLARFLGIQEGSIPVSYTHLTLPTILLV